MPDVFYITTAIDYANGEPHLGHAFEKIGADCVARYRRLRGETVHFVIGMDEHGQKVAQAAAEAGVDPQEWVDRIAAQFRTAWDELGVRYDDFIRTTEPRHTRTVQELFRRIRDRGYLRKGLYRGYYCVGCEAFKLEKDLDEAGRCPIHPTRQVDWVEEPNYFFELSRFQDALLRRYEKHPAFVRPQSKMNEITNIVRDGLQDISVSRARVPWGIPWPDDPAHTVYVWFEALINYLSATGFPDADYERIWPADVHVIGPDILRFHAALWPAMLEAAGLEAPRQVWCHGWVNTAGARFSKSAGVSVTLREILDRYGPDPLRYFLLREVPWDGDGTFSLERFDARYAAELADGYGNLVSRVLSMVGRYCDGTVPAHAAAGPLDRLGDEVIERYRDVMDRHLLHEGAAETWRLVTRANRYIEEQAPWTLYKEDRTDALHETLGALCDAIARITLLLAPYMPRKTADVWELLGGAAAFADVTWATVQTPRRSGSSVRKPPPLFPKPEPDAVTR